MVVLSVRKSGGGGRGRNDGKKEGFKGRNLVERLYNGGAWGCRGWFLLARGWSVKGETGRQIGLKKGAEWR